MVNFDVEIQGIINPTTSREWTWSMTLEKFGKVYASSVSVTISIDEAKTVSQIDNIDIGMDLANTGERATYTFKIPRLEGLTEGITDLYIEFPHNLYDEALGKNILCSTSGIRLQCFLLSNRRILVQNIDTYYVQSPMLSINVEGIVQPKVVGSISADFTYTMAL